MLDTEKKVIPPQGFASLFKDENIGTVNNLTPEEILAFRNVSKHYDMRYTVTAGGKKCPRVSGNEWLRTSSKGCDTIGLGCCE